MTAPTPPAREHDPAQQSARRVPGEGHAGRALHEARARGWRIHLDDHGPVLTALVASLSPALVERLKEHADALAAVLMEDGQ